MRVGGVEAVGERLVRGKVVTVRAVGLEGESRWSFGGEVLADTGDEVVLLVREGEPVAGPEPWAWPAAGVLHLWRRRPYGVLVTTRARRFPYWYCAIHTPAVPQGDEIRVTDLDLDVQLFADGRYSIAGAGPDADRHPDLAAMAQAAVQELAERMTRKTPPFDGKRMPRARENG